MTKGRGLDERFKLESNQDAEIGQMGTKGGGDVDQRLDGLKREKRGQTGRYRQLRTGEKRRERQGEDIVG